PPAENNATSRPLKSAVSVSSTVISVPAHGNFLPAERAEAKNLTLLAGKLRSASSVRITPPTCPVAPKTPRCMPSTLRGRSRPAPAARGASVPASHRARGSPHRTDRGITVRAMGAVARDETVHQWAVAEVDDLWSPGGWFGATRVRPALPAALLGIEVVLLLAVSLGRSAIHSVVAIIEQLTRPARPLSEQTTSMNTSVVPDRPWLDLSYQVLGIVLPVAPALLAMYLLSVTLVRPFRLVGFDGRLSVTDLVLVLIEALVMGI